MSSHHPQDSSASRPGERPGAEPERLTPYELLHAHIDEVLAEWRALMRYDPWTLLQPARLMDALPEMLPKLFRLAQSGAGQIGHDLSEFIAHHHGFHRREDRVPLSALADEWNHVKRACWKVLQRHGLPEADAALALHRLDALIDDAIGFSLRGYYGPELDSLRGRGLERRAAPERRGSGGDRRGHD